jgi:hypothetical protein
MFLGGQNFVVNQHFEYMERVRGGPAYACRARGGQEAALERSIIVTTPKRNNGYPARTPSAKRHAKDKRQGHHQPSSQGECPC